MQNPAHCIPHLHAAIAASTCDCDSVLELGCGVGDKLAATACGIRHGVDVHRPYLERARSRWGGRLTTLTLANAITFVAAAKRKGARKLWDAVMLIDFLEHLELEPSRQLLADCMTIARQRVIVLVPEGFLPQQDIDVHNLGGEKWQQHRSAWTAGDLEERGFDVARWENRHGPGVHALFATWDQPRLL